MSPGALVLDLARKQEELSIFCNWPLDYLLEFQ